MPNTSQLLEREVTVTKGNNIGYTIIQDLEQANLYNHIDIKTITPTRDKATRNTIVKLRYVFIPNKKKQYGR